MELTINKPIKKTKIIKNEQIEPTKPKKIKQIRTTKIRKTIQQIELDKTIFELFGEDE